ncbi:MAG: hypothetical protein JXA42_00980 [Anaerolineales bacterium]|nr:hypothetical protein [Anaerolineales bacterium]
MVSNSRPHFYQSWRSPVVEVISDVIHVNAPLTPNDAAEPSWVELTSFGPQPQVITVPFRSTVGRVAWMDASTSIADLVRLTSNPIWQPRPRGVLDQLINTLGFDGGMLAPGGYYFRLFDEPGVYAYTDGAGHDGLVVVEENGFSIFLPLVLRQ